MKKRTDAQRATFMSSPDYSKLLPEFTVNLLVRDIDASLAYYRDVFGATTRYHDPDFAAMQIGGLDFMLHADHTYDQHPWYGELQSAARRGLGAELRLLGVDPDAVAVRAKAAGATVLAQPTNKGHGWREVWIEDPDGYVWAVGVLTEAANSSM